ncbi:MAG: hypothetical protein HKO90_08445 [Flavobacteriaceae bacterium]|nr:hypothetical protein [Flavobacteriaceae bacterium]
MFKFVLHVLVIALFFSCEHSEIDHVQEVNIPAGSGSGQSDLMVSRNGDLFLSWIQTDSLNMSKLYISQYEKGQWLSPVLIAKGNNWFVNWADFPSIENWGDKNLTAHYLQKSGSDTYAYDVKLCVSTDYGKTWGNSFSPHNDGTLTEHGFVSKVGVSDSTYRVAWLDGRQFAYAEKDSGFQKQMSLRSAVFGDFDTPILEDLIDNRVCDCCQTALTMTQDGPLIVYRNRTEDEIRDIYFSRYVENEWSDPQPVYNDNWKIHGCPVNGPAVQSKGENVAVAWFAMNGEFPEVKLSFLNNSGMSFNDPIAMDYTYPSGRIDLAWIDEKDLIVSWMDQMDTNSTVVLQKASLDGSKGPLHTITITSAERSTGFPRMTIYDDMIWLTWTEIANTSHVKVVKFPLDKVD